MDRTIPIFERMEVALRTVRPVEARIVAALLAGYHIRSIIRGTLPFSILPLGFHDTTLLVPESQLADAERLIRTHRSHLRLVYSQGREY